jgi:GR25 family glycosyltransferase involved in LPS biosynthesis
MKSLTHWPFCLFHGGFTEIAIALQKLFCFLDPKPVRFRALYYFQEGKLLRAMGWEGEQDYPVYVINRTKDIERMSLFDASCRKWGINYERVEGIDCADPKFDFIPYEAEIGKAFYGKTKFLRGAVGCFLSHVQAWRKIIEANIPGAIICEDDARFLGPIPKKIANYDFPSECDLVYINQRIASGVSFINDPTELNANFNFFTIFRAAMRLFEIQSTISAPGGEGYLLTRSGAKKLLSIYDALHIYMEVDWFLFFHSLSQSERMMFLSKDATGRFDMLDFASEKLNSYVLLPSFVEQRSMGSIISFEKPENYIERDAMFEEINN